MSIYAGHIWSILVALEHRWPHRRDVVYRNELLYDYVEVYAMLVPGHIGRADEGYEEGDPYAEFLPPVSEHPDTPRAWVILGPRDEKRRQQYVNPLLVLTDAEYRAMPWPEMLDRIMAALDVQQRIRPNRQRETVK